MSNTINSHKGRQCSINLTPKSTNKALSKMKMSKIPSIAVDALNIINNASYSNLHNPITK